MSLGAYEARLAREAIKIDEKIDRDFVNKEGGLASWLLSASRKEAIKAMSDLVDADPTETETIRALQNDIKRNRDLVTWIQGARDLGQEAWMKLSQLQQEEIERAVRATPTTGDE
jgi:hypothetical protein